MYVQVYAHNRQVYLGPTLHLLFPKQWNPSTMNLFQTSTIKNLSSSEFQRDLKDPLVTELVWCPLGGGGGGGGGGVFFFLCCFILSLLSYASLPRPPPLPPTTHTHQTPYIIIFLDKLLLVFFTSNMTEGLAWVRGGCGGWGGGGGGGGVVMGCPFLYCVFVTGCHINFLFSHFSAFCPIY